MLPQIAAHNMTSRANILTRRALHMSSIVRAEGATGSSKQFGEKEKAAENRWAKSHDAELLKSLKSKLAEHEKSSQDIKQKLSELEPKKK